MSFPLHLSAFTRKELSRRLQQVYASGSLKLVKRLHALLALAQGQSVSDVAEMLSLGEQTVRDSRHQYLRKGLASLVSQAPPGRPRKLTKTQRQQLAEWSKASPQGAGAAQTRACRRPLARFTAPDPLLAFLTSL